MKTCIRKLLLYYANMVMMRQRYENKICEERKTKS